MQSHKDLLEDLLRNSGTHFLGSIILKRPKHVTGTADKAIVIDGQQRLTTLSVLIKALYDSIENKGNKLITDATAALFYTLKSAIIFLYFFIFYLINLIYLQPILLSKNK